MDTMQSNILLNNILCSKLGDLMKLPEKINYKDRHI